MKFVYETAKYKRRKKYKAKKRHLGKNKRDKHLYWRQKVYRIMEVNQKCKSHNELFCFSLKTKESTVNHTNT